MDEVRYSDYAHLVLERKELLTSVIHSCSMFITAATRALEIENDIKVAHIDPEKMQSRRDNSNFTLHKRAARLEEDLRALGLFVGQAMDPRFEKDVTKRTKWYNSCHNIHQDMLTTLCLYHPEVNHIDYKSLTKDPVLDNDNPYSDANKEDFDE